MPTFDERLSSRAGEQHRLFQEHVNPQLVKVLRTIGFDRDWRRAEGPYLFDADGNRYLDFLAGFGVFNVGRGHPEIRRVLHEVLDSEYPNLIHMDCSLAAGLLAEKLVSITPEKLDRVFFTNSGTESVEAAIKFARCATGRKRIVSCDHAFHGLTNGSLSLNGNEEFRDGFGPLLEDCVRVPFNDLEALEARLARRDVACFVVEPIQGKGVYVASPEYLPEAQRLCARYGTLFALDEVQTGFGRTGKMFALEHWGVEPDLLMLSKALSGGFVPVGALLYTEAIYKRVFSRMDRCMVHSNTFGQNNLACAAGLATIEALEKERVAEHAARMGELLLRELAPLVQKHEFIKEVRGKGLMLGIEFHKPSSFKLKMAWSMLHKINAGLFSQLIVIPLLRDHRILTQVAGHNVDIVKLLPVLAISEEDVAWFVSALDSVVEQANRVPGALWDLGKTLAAHALKRS